MVGKPFISIWAGEAYNIAYLIVILLMAAAAIPVSFNTAHVILQAKNKQKFSAIVLTLVVIFNVIISVFACKRIGLLGCTLGTVIAYIIGNVIVMGIYFYKELRLDMKTYIKDAITIILSSAMVFVMAYIFRAKFSSDILSMILNILIYSVLFIIMNYLVVFNEYEKELFRKVLRRNRK